MSATGELTNSYATFFNNSFLFAVSPYLVPFYAVATHGRNEQNPNILGASLVVGILTFVVPVLPMLFSMTSALACVAISLAIASMFVLYPLALFNDYCDPVAQNAFQL